MNILVALSLVLAGGAFAYVTYRLDQINRIAIPGLKAASGGPFTILIVGSDTRQLAGKGNSQFGGAANTPGQRSDTIMLARVVPQTASLTLMSIPRDLWEPIKGIGYSKINAAFDSGPNLLISTIHRDLGIPISHLVEVNFDTFRQITDAVGGVEFYFPTPAKDAYSLLNVPHAGCVKLTGNQALGFVRSRHYQYKVGGQWQTQGLSDLARISRQQAFVKKMIKKAESEFTNPVALNGVISGITKNLTVDKGFSNSDMIGLARDFRRANVNGIPTETLPVTNIVTADGQDALQLQQPQASQMIHHFISLGDNTAGSQAKPVGKIAPSSVHVIVANGSGVAGQAAVASGKLKQLGYKAQYTNYSPGFSHTSSQVQYAPGSLVAARQLQAHIHGGAGLVEVSSLSSAAYKYNLELVTGQSYSAGATAGTPHSAPTTTYLLPGPQPSAKELASC